MTEIGADWRTVDGVATTWFEARSMTEGAALVGRILELSPGIVVDLRATGMRVRATRWCSSVARELRTSDATERAA